MNEQYENTRIRSVSECPLLTEMFILDNWPLTTQQLIKLPVTIALICYYRRI